MKPIDWCASIVLCAFCVASFATAVAQQLGTPRNPDEKRVTEINAWRNTPIVISSQKDRSDAATRQARDQYWEKVFPHLPPGVIVGYTHGGVLTPSGIPKGEFTKDTLKYLWRSKLLYRGPQMGS